MKASLIYWPVLAQLAIPVWVLLLNGKRKRIDQASGKYNPDSAIDNKAWSLPVVLTSNALANQFQLPIIFYALCFILANINAVSSVVVGLCWFYVVARWVHAYVHVSSNNVAVRKKVFIVSSLILAVLFGVTIFQLAQV